MPEHAAAAAPARLRAGERAVVDEPRFAGANPVACRCRRVIGTCPGYCFRRLKVMLSRAAGTSWHWHTAAHAAGVCTTTRSEPVSV
jgi:hypothetical protein